MPTPHEMELRAERQHYSDRLREKGQAECPYHEGQPDYPLCPDCQGMREAYEENRMDAEREER